MTQQSDCPFKLRTKEAFREMTKGQVTTPEELQVFLAEIEKQPRCQHSLQHFTDHGSLWEWLEGRHFWNQLYIMPGVWERLKTFEAKFVDWWDYNWALWPESEALYLAQTKSSSKYHTVELIFTSIGEPVSVSQRSESRVKIDFPSGQWHKAHNKKDKRMAWDKKVCVLELLRLEPVLNPIENIWYDSTIAVHRRFLLI